MYKRLPTLKKCETALKLPAAKWAGRCHEIALALVEAGLVPGCAVYGHFTGRVHSLSYFGDRAGLGFVRHGWVQLPDGRVFDPTRWTFEAKSPYLYVGSPEDYDEGGTKLRAAQHGPPPDYDADERQFEFSPHVLPSEAWCFVEKLLRVDVLEQDPGVLSFPQVLWLANCSVDTLQPHAQAIYEALGALHQSVLIPLDNLRKLERLTGERACG